MKSLLHKEGKDLFNHDNTLVSHCLLDIDNFGIYNLTYGHSAGNFVFYTLSEMIKRQDPHQQYCIGSDEIYFSFKENIALEKCTIILRDLKQKLGVTASIGIVKLKVKQKPDLLFQLLKSNVNIAKENGKNLICEL